MAEYISESDVEDRLTSFGVTFVADDDNDGEAESGEITQCIGTSIVYAGGIVDFHICDQITPAAARAAGNQWLKDRCVDIAANRAAGWGGRDVPQTLKDDLAATLEMLQQVKEGATIPGLEYPSTKTGIVRKRPGVINISKECC